jgi:hypothetical protein
MTYPDAQAVTIIWRPLRDELEAIREITLLERRAFKRVAERMAAGQLGECFHA